MDSRRLASVGLLLLVPLALCTTCDNDELTEGAALYAFGSNDSVYPPLKCSSGVCKDPATGLEWQVTPTGGSMNWSEAKAHCAGLSLDGGGWHLPTIGELRTLIRGCPETQKDGACGVTDSCLSSSCRNGPCDGCSYKDGPGEGGMYWPDEIEGDCCWYWSSSAVEDYDYRAWPVNFNYGYVTNDYVNYDSPVRCVR